MPAFVKVVHYGIAATLLVLASLTGWDVAAHGMPLFGVWFPILCIIAFVGLVRRVSWGRFLVSLLSIRVVLFVVASLVPNFDDADGGLLERWFGFLPPIWLMWLIVVVSATLVLLPAVIIGWRKAWFRAAWW